MIKTRRAQFDFGDEFMAGFIAQQPESLWEPWMRQVDQALEEEGLLEIIQDAWKRLCKKEGREFGQQLAESGADGFTGHLHRGYTKRPIVSIHFSIKCFNGDASIYF